MFSGLFRARWQARQCTCLFLFLVASPSLAGTTRIQGTAEIVDGDTLRLGPVIIRIHGIDAPEAEQHCKRRGGRDWNCGKAATDAIAELAAGREIECRPTDRDASREVASW